MSDLARKQCTPCSGDTPKTPPEQVDAYLKELKGWEAPPDRTAIFRAFEFKNFHETMAFVNAVAWIAHKEDHHPDLEVGYKRCRVQYATHAIGGLSDNDFICAAKVDALLAD